MDEKQRDALEMALTQAAAAGQTEIVKALLEAGVDIHNWDDEPIMRAAENGHAETVRFLLTMGADPHGTEALIRAAKHGQIETIRALFEYADKKSSTGPTPRPPSPAP